MLRWLHYVDDTFTTLRKDEIDDFHEHLNRDGVLSVEMFVKIVDFVFV